jgi:hypothetical protein
MKKENKQTFTYSCRPSIRKKAIRRAQKVGSSLSEVIEIYLETYAELPIYKTVATGQPIKQSPYPTEVRDKD